MDTSCRMGEFGDINFFLLKNSCVESNESSGANAKHSHTACIYFVWIIKFNYRAIHESDKCVQILYPPISCVNDSGPSYCGIRSCWKPSKSVLYGCSHITPFG